MSVSQDDLDECWCCGGLHDSYRTLCPDCHDAGCNRFDDECDSDHKPVLTDGGTSETVIERSGRHDLEVFEAPDEPQIATFETDELTAVCPFEFGGPDYYKLTLRYKTGDFCVESRSLKEFLESVRDWEISAEKLADEIHWLIREEVEPEELYVRLEQARRGGIKETVEVGDVGLR